VEEFMRTSLFTRAAAVAVAFTVVSTALAFGQGDAGQVIAGARQALGAKKLGELKTLTATGRSQRTGPTGSTIDGDFEMALELPDKFVRRDVMAALGNASIYRLSGFNGEGVISETDMPPQLSTGNVVVQFRSAGAGGVDPNNMTPEQKEAMRQAQLQTARRDFTRLALGMLVTLPSYPVTFTRGGTAESPDGTADIIDVKGENFTARLFIDTKTHLPLMLSWMDKEPMQRVIRMGGPGGPGAPAGATATTVTSGGATTTTVTAGGGGNVTVMQGGGGAAVAGAAGGQGTRTPPTPEEVEKMRQQAEAQMKEADAKRRTVEYRIFYADYKSVDGVMLPHRIQSSVDGKPTEEITLEKVKVNQKLDAKRFTVSK
jgi:hypothetical protein